MSTIWKDGKLTVELHVADVRALEKAKHIGEALREMHQPGGAPLVEAIDGILDPGEGGDDE